MTKPSTIADYQKSDMNHLSIVQSPEKRLIGNLVSQANEIIERDGYTEDAKEIVQAIAILKHN
ncbi:hypothetical protein [Sporolactobacillus terrae]|uniref:Uncharacterized protein n=1 Tax=Sporolactobacillus terrae TaxID=269673 RepID=A0A5K7X037_9BACL|nr:hypothetical protein [Sporolactobacillus terrae]BBN97456.1 hypothetical protein St703_01610 [Sporolactobacillus terrae]